MNILNSEKEVDSQTWAGDIDLLCCPVCKNILNNSLYCVDCKIQFSVFKNIPVLINEQNSIFSFNDYSEENGFSFFGKKEEKRGKSMSKLFRKLLPSSSINYAAKNNYALLNSLCPPASRVLIIGGGETGSGMKSFLSNPNIKIIVTDVSFVNDIHVVCDCHDLPFQSDSFDCVITQAVLEHVIDPFRCVEEIYRVLKENGIVYAETPFMQQVHGGAYDFTRFTWLGHRRLFRKFEEIKSGTCVGAGSALIWSWRYFLRSFSSNTIIMKILGAFAILTSFFWKYFDYYLKKKPNSIDSASGNFFLGRKITGYLLNDKELIKLYDQKKRELKFNL